MKPACRVSCALSSLAAVVLAAASLLAAEPRTSKPEAVNYGRPFEPPTRPALIPLPPGAVEPAGWLRDWCLAARDGYTGHMDEVHEEFKRAWAADHRMTGDRLNWSKGAWPYEGGGYWFDGLVRLGYVLHDDALIQQAKRRFDVVVTHMNPNSILFLWWLNKNNAEDRKAIACDSAWPMWASGLLGRGMAAYYAGSGDNRVLQTLEAGYGGGSEWLRMGWGMSNPWPAFETYTWTGNKEIAAALTTLFSKDGGGKNTQEFSWNRYRKMPDMKPGAEANDHVVHFLESTTPWALGYLWTGNREFLDATLGWHDLLERVAMQPSGVPVADEFYGPTGAFRGTETCDVAGYLWSQIVLLSVSGQGRMADRAERAFFNAGPATVARDFRTHVYFQSPNRVVDNSPPCPHGPGASGCSYKATHYPLCCTAALNRIVPNYVMHMWMATYDNGLAATHYGPCKVTALAADRVPVEIVCRTDYPFNEVIEIAVKPAREAAFPLSFRIPGWCKNPELSVNGTSVKVAPDAKGFVRVERLWRAGDAVRLRFPMAVSVATGRDNNAQGAPYASVSYGPLLFALPIADTQGPNIPDPAVKWNYALDTQGGKLEQDIVLERQAMPAQWNWPLASPLKLRTSAVAIDWNPDPKAPRLPAKAVMKQEQPERITLVPYGCTKFRISMFPVSERVSKPAGIFDQHADVGQVGLPGSADFDAARQVYRIKGGGENMWANIDAFHFAHKQVSGDFDLSARISWPKAGGNAHRKACLMIRQSLAPDSPYVDAVVHGDGLTSLQFRDTPGGPTREVRANVQAPPALRLERHGEFIVMSVGGADGSFRHSGCARKLVFTDPVYVGLAVCAHDNKVIEEAEFAEVRLTPVAPAAGKPRLNSTLEIVPIGSKDRQAIYHSTTHFEAPNWSPDGSHFVFNSQGSLFRLPVKGGTPERIDTGLANRCNNDHGFSPDGKQIAISDQSKPGGKSLIYVLPATGGTPKLITPTGPSYWHGWSPDGKTLAYCAERGGKFDVYTIPAVGGEERRLTTAEGLDDGPEYSPDGRKIYFNSDRTGRMQIWRMNPDGSAQEPVTNDEFNNWFAHPSPDGKWLVFLSYEKDVKDHPANKDVRLRLMPAAGGPIQELATLFGGQGTINVPSWSPDSKSVAFVSYHFTNH